MSPASGYILDKYIGGGSLCWSTHSLNKQSGEGETGIGEAR